MKTSEELRKMTATSHQKLEKSVVGMIRSIADTGDYVHLLNLFYSYFGALEQVINKQLSPGFLPDWPERRKTAGLVKDLNVLQSNIPALTAFEYLPLITNNFHVMGALYVMEGSTLGGPYIVQMIRKKLPAAGDVFKFFSGYGESNGFMWEQFRESLDQCTKNEEEVTMILSAAENTFQKFDEWIHLSDEAIS